MLGRPGRDEAAEYYFRYIDRVAGDDVLARLEAQLGEVESFFSGISEEASLFRYAPDKWSVREVVNHVADTERAFQFRAFWFGRGFETPLASFDQDTAVTGARADERAFSTHVEDLRRVRAATLSLFAGLPADTWLRRGVASGNPVSVRALAWIAAGHFAHHLAILRERYFGPRPGQGPAPKGETR